MAAFNVLNIAALGDKYVIVKKEPVILLVNIGALIMKYRRWLIPLYIGVYLGTDINIITPIRCQLLEYEEALRITEDADPYGVSFLRNLKRFAMRMSISSQELITVEEEGVMAPYTRAAHCACTGALFCRLFLSIHFKKMIS
jgi:hypothetical protein